MSEYIAFTKEMKKDYTILAPNMLPVHFKLIAQVLKGFGLHVEILETQGPHIAETGLKYVHNDTCYPAILVIGQFIDALQSGKYDLNKVALILFQTGGGCRASNYIPLLRKALKKAGFGQVPVISLSLRGLEKHPGFRLTLPMLQRMMYSIIYGDMILSLTNQVKPYELHPGDTDAVSKALTREMVQRMKTDGIRRKNMERNCRYILDEYGKIPVRQEKKIRVGVVGEIYVKYSPLGNNNLEKFLLNEGAEVVMPGLLDFCMYYVYNTINESNMYHIGMWKARIFRAMYRWLNNTQAMIIRTMNEDGRYRPPTAFSQVLRLAKDFVNPGCCMGEGWLLPAEMLELSHMGVQNIVCAQPFGCLPNHICGKGMMKPLKDKNPRINIVAIDYDAGATTVNQENRIKLMLSNAKGS